MPAVIDRLGDAPPAPRFFEPLPLPGERREIADRARGALVRAASDADPLLPVPLIRRTLAHTEEGSDSYHFAFSGGRPRRREERVRLLLIRTRRMLSGYEALGDFLAAFPEPPGRAFRRLARGEEHWCAPTGAAAPMYAPGDQWECRDCFRNARRLEYSPKGRAAGLWVD